MACGPSRRSIANLVVVVGPRPPSAFGVTRLQRDNAGGIHDRTSPCRRRCAARRARRESRRRPCPCAPPTIATRLRVPLCASAAMRGNTILHEPAIHERRGAVIAVSRARRARCRRRRCARTAPRADELPALDRAEGDRQVRRHASRSPSPVDASSPLGTSSATTRAPSLRSCAMRSSIGDRAARFALRARAEDAVDDELFAASSARRASTSMPRATHARRARQSVFGSPTSTTRTRTPTAASAPATTHASPPLLPGPAKTATPRARRSPNACTISRGRGRAGALHQRARRNAARDRGAIARRRIVRR